MAGTNKRRLEKLIKKGPNSSSARKTSKTLRDERQKKPKQTKDKK